MAKVAMKKMPRAIITSIRVKAEADVDGIASDAGIEQNQSQLIANAIRIKPDLHFVIVLIFRQIHIEHFDHHAIGELPRKSRAGRGGGGMELHRASVDIARSTGRASPDCEIALARVEHNASGLAL